MTTTAGQQIAYQANGNVNINVFGTILYNVKAYGAKGDGIKDDTVAIQAAINTAIAAGGKAIFFPHGIYKVTALISLASVVLFGDNASFSGISNTISQFGENNTAIISTQDTSYQILKLVAGTDLSAGLYGDSIYAGYDGTVYVAVKIDATIQAVLRSYYNNAAATVTNHAIQGTGTNYWLPLWPAIMATSTENVIFINYGVNDAQGTPSNPAISAAQYRLNLIAMVTIAKAAGKVVILDTPNFVMNIGVGTQLKAETVKQFARVMRDVAEYTNCTLIDSSYWLEKLLESKPKVADWIPDGIHLSQEANNWKARLLVSALITPNTTLSSKNQVMGVGSPKFKTDSTVTVLSSVNSIVGFELVANKIRFGVFIEEPGLDLYIANTVWNFGTTAATIKVDGVTVGTMSNYDANISAVNYIVVDQEIMVLENASIGFHFLEIDASGVSNTGLNYARVYPTRQRDSFKVAANGITYKQKVLDNPILTAALAGYNTFLTDIPMSRLTRNVTVEVVGTLAGNEGIVLFGHKIGGAVGVVDPMAGVLMWLNNGLGNKLTASEPTTIGAYSATLVGAVDLAAVQHTYKFVCATNGVISIFIDGVASGTPTYTQTGPYIGGFLGFWKAGTGSMNISSVHIY